MSSADFGISPEELKELNRKAYEEMRVHEAAQAAKRKDALEFASSIVGKRKLRHINEYIDDVSYTCDFEITDTHGGHRQDEPGYAFRYVYLDQYCNGGYSGDDFAGHVWIPLPKGKYLHFHYSC